MTTDNDREMFELLQDLLARKEGLKERLEGLLNTVMKAEVNEHVCAKPYERTNARRGMRNATQARSFKTSVGQLALELPQVRYCEPYHPSIEENKLQASQRTHERHPWRPLARRTHRVFEACRRNGVRMGADRSQGRPDAGQLRVMPDGMPVAVRAQASVQLHQHARACDERGQAPQPGGGHLSRQGLMRPPAWCRPDRAAREVGA